MDEGMDGWDPPMWAVVQAVVQSLAQHRVLVVDAPGGLQHRVQQAVAGRAVPQGVEPAVQSCAQLQGPVDDGGLLLQFCTDEEAEKEKVREEEWETEDGEKNASSATSGLQTMLKKKLLTHAR